MRTALLMPIAAAALAAAAIASWGPGLAGLRAGVPDHRPPSAVGSGYASQAIGSSTSQLPAMAAPRYRAEACSGDYVCRGGGAWEPIEGASAGTWPLTGDGF